MTDIFDAKIMCKKCNVQMNPITLEKNGAQIRAVECSKCKDKIIHPADLNCLNRFNDLKGRTFDVKLRMVGNSHAISIPKEIVDFMNEQQRAMGDFHETHRRMRKEMEDMVRLAFEDMGKLSLSFGNFDENDEKEEELSEDNKLLEARRRLRKNGWN